jgi:hypothetical protein
MNTPRNFLTDRAGLRKNQSRNRKTDLGGYLIQGKLGTVE